MTREARPGQYPELLNNSLIQKANGVLCESFTWLVDLWPVMSDILKQTLRIARESKVKTDDRGRSVWAEPAEEAELELVSTMMLKQMLQSENVDQKQRLAKAASGKQGVLAHNVGNDDFEIIDDDDLKAALASADSRPSGAAAADVTYEPLLEQADTGDEELSLVSTQALRQILSIDDDEDDTELDPGGGFDPYNNA